MLGFLEDAVDSAGKVAGAAVDAVSGASGEFSKLVDKIPVVGSAFKGVYDYSIGSNITFAKAISDGNRIDKAAAKTLKEKVKGVQKVAPYAQTIISLVPGVGTSLSGAIGFGLALAAGQPLDQAVVTGIRDSLPGGPAVKIAFNVSVDALKGKPIDEIAINSLPISEAARSSIKTGIGLTVAYSKGEKLSKASYDLFENNIMPKIPDDYRKAMVVGASVGVGIKAQKKAVKSVPLSIIQKITDKGLLISKTNPALDDGIKNSDDEEKEGFYAALGLLSYVIKPVDLRAIRGNLNNKQKAGFDKGTAVHIGRVFSVPPRKLETPEQLFTYWVSKGLIHADEELKVNTTSKFKDSLPARHALMVAVDEKARANSWWHRFLMWMGIEKND